jgi:hypothetical protein
MTQIKSLMILLSLFSGLHAVHLTDKTVVAQTKKDAAPPFTLKLLSGGQLKSTELEGKVAVLKFVASW